MPADRVAAKEVARLLQGLQTSLKEKGVKPENMRVQLESELLASLDIPPKKLVQWAEQKLGLKLILLDWREKARQAYLGCISGLSPKSQAGTHLVISIEDRETLLSLGRGLSWDRDLSTRLPVGLSEILLENPLDIIDVALARNELAQKLQAQPEPEQLSCKTAYLARHEIDDVLFNLDARRRPGGLGMQRTGLDFFLLQWYLSQAGLFFLQQQMQTDALTLEQAKFLLKRLVILAELARRFELSRFYFGEEKGAVRAVLDEMAKAQIVRHAQGFGAALAEQAQEQYAHMEAALRRIFPTHNLRGRIKTQTSITEKLTRKAMRTAAPIYHMRSLEEAGELVSDGIGFCLILEDASYHRIEQVCDSLVFALRNEQIQILELKNYRGTGEHALPYFTSVELHRIQRSVQAQENHPPLLLQNDLQATKGSGYTTVQFVLRLKNPQTQQFDLPPCELQIRGKLVDAFYTLEHSIRDIRLGKRDSLQENALSEERLALLEAVSNLDEAGFETLLGYLNAYYGYCRRLENQLPAEVPQKPEALSGAFDLARLMETDAAPALSAI
jgi:ppGpp synthetase/RelA/SpoT-type nucleotidyltranferase